jgi:hypothetical protein
MSESLLAAADMDQSVRSENNGRRNEEEDRCWHPMASKTFNNGQILFQLLSNVGEQAAIAA